MAARSGVLAVVRPSDAVLPAFFAAVATAEMTLSGFRPLLLSLSAYLLACLVLAVRRAAPATAPVMVCAIAAGAGLVGGRQAFIDSASWLLPPALACFSSGLLVPRRRLLFGLAGVTVAGATSYAALLHLAGFDADVLFGLIVYLGPWAAGLALRVTLDRTALMAQQLERARLVEEHTAADGAARERLRIARELHDVLAHSLTVMVVQASVAEDLVRADPDGAVSAVRHVQERGRAVLDETARLLRDRHTDDHGPTDLDALVDDYRAAGLDVDATIDASDLPGVVGLAVRRTVEEGLTNALRHAPGRAVSLRVTRTPDAVRVVVANCGEGPAPREPRLGTGLGLPGLRERVARLGGRLDVDDDPRRFTLDVTLPLGTTA